MPAVHVRPTIAPQSTTPWKSCDCGTNAHAYTKSVQHGVEVKKNEAATLYVLVQAPKPSFKCFISAPFAYKQRPSWIGAIMARSTDEDPLIFVTRSHSSSKTAYPILFRQSLFVLHENRHICHFSFDVTFPDPDHSKLSLPPPLRISPSLIHLHDVNPVYVTSLWVASLGPETVPSSATLVEFIDSKESKTTFQCAVMKTLPQGPKVDNDPWFLIRLPPLETLFLSASQGSSLTAMFRFSNPTFTSEIISFSRPHPSSPEEKPRLSLSEPT